MSHYFIKSPDGKYHVFSSVVDDFITIDCTADEAIASELAMANNPHDTTLKRCLLREISNIEQTGRAWKGAHTWDEAIRLIVSLHGDSRESLKMLIDCGSLSIEAIAASKTEEISC